MCMHWQCLILSNFKIRFKIPYSYSICEIRQNVFILHSCNEKCSTRRCIDNTQHTPIYIYAFILAYKHVHKHIQHKCVLMHTRTFTHNSLLVLHCTALCYTALHYTLLYCTIPHYTTLHYTTLHYYTALYHTTLHYTTLLHCTIPHYTTLTCSNNAGLVIIRLYMLF